MAGELGSDIASLVSRNEQTILPEWIELQKKAGTLAHRPHHRKANCCRNPGISCICCATRWPRAAATLANAGL